MKRIWDCMKLDFKYIKPELGGILCCATALAFTGMMILLALGILVVMFVLIVKIYLKLFEKSVFGEEAIFFDSLPISVKEKFIAKIITAFVSVVYSYICLYIALFAMVVASGIVADTIDITLKSIRESFMIDINAVFTVEAAAYAMGLLSFGAIVFLAIAFQKKKLAKLQGFMDKVAVIMVIAGVRVIEKVTISIILNFLDSYVILNENLLICLADTALIAVSYIVISKLLAEN